MTDNAHCTIRAAAEDAVLFDRFLDSLRDTPVEKEGRVAHELSGDFLYIHRALPDGTSLRGAIKKITDSSVDVELLVRGGTLDSLKFLISPVMDSLHAKFPHSSLTLEFHASDCEPEAP